MNWYKLAFNFKDRNFLNKKIKKFQNLRDAVLIMKNMVFQSAKIAKNNSFDIVNHKFVSSYPIIRDIMIEANSIAYDNPWKFSFLCDNAIVNIDNNIYELKQERKGLYNTDKVEKGLV